MVIAMRLDTGNDYQRTNIRGREGTSERSVEQQEKKEEEKITNKTSVTGIWENSTIEIYKQVERGASGEARGTSTRIFEEGRIMWLHVIQDAKVNKETAEENNKKKQSDKRT